METVRSRLAEQRLTDQQTRRLRRTGDCLKDALVLVFLAKKEEGRKGLSLQG
jgi:hypothetical protein